MTPHQKLKKSTFLVVLTAGIFANALAAEKVRCLTEAVADVEITSTLPGTVSAVRHGEGSFVEEGVVIIELDSKTEELDIRRREVLVDNLKSTLERSEMLLANTSSISMEEVDEARSDYQMSLIELEMARDSMNKKQLRAPFSGVVTDVFLEVGEFCEPPQVILRIVDTRQFYCEANIDPAVAARLQIGASVAYLPERMDENVRIPGEVVFISPVVDSASGLLRIKAVCSNPDGRVRPGEGGLLELLPEVQ
jgi:membrane fusion protein (multidrug efflux system)